MIFYLRFPPACCSHYSNLLAMLRVLFVTLISAIILGGCGSILPKAPIQPTLYLLDAAPSPRAKDFVNALAQPALTVNTPVASAGFGGIHIVYLRHAHELEHFALNQWVDTPVQMLTPLIVRATESSGAFRAVVRGSTAAVSELRLDTELIRLQQEFNTTPSQVRFTLRAVLVDTATRRVVASREFEATVAAASDDPGGGVIAANEAVKRALAELAKFCAESATRFAAEANAR